MTNFEDDDLDNIDDQNAEGGEAAEGGQARPGGNRNFIIAAGILGGIFLLLVVALLVVALVVLPQRRAQQQAANDAIATQNADAEVAATKAAEEVGPNAQLLTPSTTPTITLTPVPPTPTFTQVVARATDTPASPVTSSSTPVDARTATVAALLTQAAEAKITRTATATGAAGGVVTSTTLPKTGFADEVGLPGLFGLSLVLIAVIVLVRRLRLSTSS